MKPLIPPPKKVENDGGRYSNNHESIGECTCIHMYTPVHTLHVHTNMYENKEKKDQVLWDDRWLSFLCGLGEQESRYASFNSQCGSMEWVMSCQMFIGHQNLFFYLWGTASCPALPTHWFLGHLLSQSLWLPVWACATGLWSGICRKDLEEGLCLRKRWETGWCYSVFTLPLAFPDLVRESPETSAFRLHQSPLQVACPQIATHLSHITADWNQLSQSVT